MENEVHDCLSDDTRDDQGDIVKREREQKLQSYREASRKVVRDYLKERVANQYYGGIALGKNHQSKVAAAEFILRYLEDSPHANLEGIENHPDYRLHYRALDQDIFGQGMQSLFGASKLGALFHELTTVSSANIKRFYATDGYLPRLIEGEDNISLQSMGHHTLQDLDKHYVNLLLTDQKRGMRSINIAELFNADAPNQPPPDKLHVLITGAAGMGKSALMRYITYHWGKGELYQNRFDYVFRVQLKLAVGNWVAPRSDPHRYQGHLKSNLIGCFVDYSLRQDFNVYTGLGPDRLLDIFNQRADRVLLLLDGYDEVSASNDESVLGIIEELFKLPYVAVTSRPEAIGDSFKSDDRCFDRCMNLLGFSREAMNVYVSRYFEYLPEQNDCTQQRQQEVKLALLQPSIYRLVKTPLNLALLCAPSVLPINNLVGGN